VRGRRGAAAVVMGLAVVAGTALVMAPGVAAAAGPSGVAGSSAVTPAAGGPGPLPRGTRARGAVPATSVLTAEVALRPADPAALEAFDEAVTTPSSPLYRHFLARGQFAARFGPPASAIAATRSWLRTQGLDVGATTPDGLLIPVSGSAATVGRAFGVGFDQDQLASGRMVHEPTARPVVPSALASSVAGVVGLDDLAVATPQIRRPPAGPRQAPATAGARSEGPVPHSGPSACGAAQSVGATAPELAQAYSMSSLEPADEGQNVTVAIYELEPYLPSDITVFKNCYAINPTVTPVSVDGTPTNDGPGSGEAALDIEMVMGLAPQASIDVYVGRNGGDGPLDVYSRMVTDDAAQVLSTSWGECEPEAGTAVVEFESELFQEAAAQGQSMVAASGDEGSEDCDFPGIDNDTSLEVDDPGSQPWVTSVGGTELSSLGPPPVESVWNTGASQGTTGGGNSRLWTMPSWQLGPGVESADTLADDSYTGAPPCPLSAGGGTVSCREVPDVSSDGDPSTGYATFWSGEWVIVGGTSMGAPLWAALTALADENGATPRRLGLLSPALYQAGCASPRPFNDITAGDNQPVGSPPSDPPHLPGGVDYPATPGYDMASGLGTPIASELIPDLITPANACPSVSGMSVASGPSGGGTVVTVTGANLGGVGEVDFGPGNAGTVLSVSASSVTVRTPASPTAGWDTAQVVVKAGADAIGFDGRNYFTYTGLRGYWTTAADGGIFSFGSVAFHGSLGDDHLVKPIVGMSPTASARGYWLVASDGGVFAEGDAVFHGSLGGIALDKPIVGMATTPDGGGYWLVASDGGVFAFGDAGFYGSMGGHPLNAPVVGMAATPDGGGYWLVASDGGIFAFGDAGYFGSTGGIRLDKPIVAMASTPDGDGYWLAASDGGVFAFGNAVFRGSLGGIPLDEPIVGMGTPFGGGGYWLVASDGGIFAFGDAGFAGSMGGHHLNAPMVAMAGT
jgi:hypothetical protein